MVAQPKIEGKLTKLFSLVHGDDSLKVASTRARFSQFACLASQGTSRQLQGRIEPHIDTGSASTPQKKRQCIAVAS
jgi:hypothetical protein